MKYTNSNKEMTDKELNKQIKSLLKQHKAIQDATDPEVAYDLEHELKREIHRLYYADREFEYMDKQSILIMLVMNRKYRVIPFNQFGINIDI